MKDMKSLVWIGCFLFTCYGEMAAQVYLETGVGTSVLDLCTCTEGPVIEPTPTAAVGAEVGGDLIFIDGNLGIDIFRFNPATGVTTFVGSLPAGLSSIGLVVGPDGLFYLTATGYNGSSAETLFSMNPITGAVVAIGELPPNLFIQGDLFFYNGLLYGLAVDINASNPQVVIQIPVANPAATTVVFTLIDLENMISAAVVFIDGIETVLIQGTQISTLQSGIWELNMTTGAYTAFCPGIFSGDMAAPPGYVLPPCCANDAGNLQSLSLVTACANQNITLTHLGNEVLGQGESLSFILTADSTANLPSDILQISATPTFFFDENTMTPNTVYYVAAVAAPGPPGAPDWVNGCYSLSFWAKVRWRPLPSVSFLPPQNDVCAGECQDLQLNFTGSPPFNLTFQTSSSGSQSQTFFQNTGLLQVCPPAGFVGDFTVEAVSLTDANCVCN
jgi:hypothetical protein